MHSVTDRQTTMPRADHRPIACSRYDRLKIDSTSEDVSRHVNIKLSRVSVTYGACHRNETSLWSVVTNKPGSVGASTASGTDRRLLLSTIDSSTLRIVGSNTLSTMLEMISSAMRHATNRCRINQILTKLPHRRIVPIVSIAKRSLPKMH